MLKKNDREKWNTYEMLFIHCHKNKKKEIYFNGVCGRMLIVYLASLGIVKRNFLCFIDLICMKIFIFKNCDLKFNLALLLPQAVTTSMLSYEILKCYVWLVLNDKSSVKFKIILELQVNHKMRWSDLVAQWFSTSVLE